MGALRGFLVLSALLTPPLAARAQSLSEVVHRQLDKPGVRLVAVDFYASWCEPCLKAIPKWRSMLRDHGRDGLSVVIVATQDPEGGCHPPGFPADRIVCDRDGEIAKAMKVRKLPSAFLWSFEGELLVDRGPARTIEAKIKSWLARAPRVQLQASRALRPWLEAAMTEHGKLPVIASGALRKKLDAIKRASFQERYDEDAQCELGSALPANALLSARPKRSQVELRLYSAERACVLATASARGSGQDAVRRAVRSLHRTLQKPAERLPAPRFKRAQGPDEPKVMIRFSPEPADAVILVDGQLICSGAERCRKLLPAGPHRVEMQRVGYAPQRRTVQLEGPTTLKWRLEPRWGTLSVQAPPSATIVLDGLTLSRRAKIKVDPGAHTLTVRSPCHREKRMRFEMQSGQRLTLKADLQEATRQISIRALDHRARNLLVEVWDSTQRLGHSDSELTVPRCTRSLTLKAPGLAPMQLKLQRGDAALTRTVQFKAPVVHVGNHKLSLDGSPALGPAQPALNIVLFGDLLCPGSQAVSPVLLKLQRAFPQEVRLIYKHNPQPFRAGASQAHLRALQLPQSAFWPRFARADQPPKVEPVRSAHEAERLLKRDRAEARSLGAHHMSPVLFLGDARYDGPLDEPSLRRELQAQLGRPALPRPGAGAIQASRGAPVRRLRTVKIDAFVDYQCPHSARALKVLASARARWGRKVSVRIRHRPLAFHKHALTAAKAVIAAKRQGALWRYQAQLLKHPNAMDEATLRSHARALGLDLNRFESDMHSGRTTRLIEKDLADASAYSVRSTPTLLINGVKREGHRSARSLTKAIASALSSRR